MKHEKLKDCDKRCVSAGHWIVTNIDTGETAHIVRYGVLERRRRRDKFVAQHEKLCRKAYKINHLHGDIRCELVQIVVKKARKKLDYSPKTGSGDVFRFIMDSYREMFDPGPVPGCQCGHCKYYQRR